MGLTTSIITTERNKLEYKLDILDNILQKMPSEPKFDEMRVMSEKIRHIIVNKNTHFNSIFKGQRWVDISIDYLTDHQLNKNKLDDIL